MNYGSSFSSFEKFKPFHLNKSPSEDSGIKVDEALSPRMSERTKPSFFKYENSSKDRIVFSNQKSHDFLKNLKPTLAARQSSANKAKTIINTSGINDLVIENNELKQKIEILQQERDLIKHWKKPRVEPDAKIYQEKLNFLVKNIQKFLNSSLKFQTMLREKLGQSAANLYEEERESLKVNMTSAVQEFDFLPIKYSPFSSPLRGTKSPKTEDYSSCDSEATKILEELKIEKNKTKRLQNELNNELSKKDNEMKNIRDRIIELEFIEKNKIEIEKKFIKSSSDWANEKKELTKELEKYKQECQKNKEKLQSFDSITDEIQQENVNLIGKYEELSQENYKLSESLQTYDRLYNYTKKWAEKVLDEFKNSAEAEINDLHLLLERKINDLDAIELKVNEKKLFSKKTEEFESKINNLNIKYEKKTSECEKYKKEVDELLGKYKDSIIENKETTKRFQLLEEDLEEFSKKYSEIRLELNEKIKENTELNNQLAQSEKKIKNISNNLASFELEKIRLKEDIISKEEDNKNLIGMVQEANELIDELKLEHEKTIEKTQKVEELEKAIRLKDQELDKRNSVYSQAFYLNEEIKKNQSEIMNLSTANLKLTEEKEKLANKTKESLQEIGILNEKNSNLQGLLMKTNEQLEKSNKENFEYYKELVNRNEIIEAGQIKIEELTNNLIDVTSKLENNAALVAKIQELKKNILNQDQILEEQQLDRKKNNELDIKIKKLRTKINNLRQIIKENEEKTIKNDEKIKLLTKENEKMTVLLDQSNQKSEEMSELLKIKQESIILQEKITELENEIQSDSILKKTFLVNLSETEKKITEYKYLESELINLQDMIKMKDKAIENLEFSLRDRDTLVYNLNNKENQITKLEIKGKELTESLRQNSLQLEQLLIEKENNQKKIKTLENNLNEVSDYNLYKQENIKLQEKLNNTDHNLVVLEKSLNEKEDDIKILTSQNRELQKQNTKFNEMILSYQADINQLKNIQKTKENLEFELINKEKEIKRLQDSEAANNKLNEILDAKENEKICLINIHQQETQKLSLKIDELEAENKKNSNLNSQLRVKEKELCNIKNINNSLLEQIVQKEEKNNALAKEYEKKTQVIELQNKKYSEELNNLKAIKKKLSENELELEDSKEAYEKKINKLSNELLDAKDRIASILSEYDESIIADKEEISRLNNEILKQITLSENQKKEIALLSQRILASESALQRCQNCKDF